MKLCDLPEQVNDECMAREQRPDSANPLRVYFPDGALPPLPESVHILLEMPYSFRLSSPDVFFHGLDAKENNNDDDFEAEYSQTQCTCAFSSTAVAHGLGGLPPLASMSGFLNQELPTKIPITKAWMRTLIRHFNSPGPEILNKIFTTEDDNRPLASFERGILGAIIEC